MNCTIKSDALAKVSEFLNVAQTKASITPLRGLVELDVIGKVLTMRVVGCGVWAELVCPAVSVETMGRCVIAIDPISIIANVKTDKVQFQLSKGKLSISGGAIFIHAQIVEGGQFPKFERESCSRFINLTSEDAMDWGIVDEPTVPTAARDTIWIGICPNKQRLYASSASGQWAAAVMDGKDPNAMPIPASILRRIKLVSGDQLFFEAKKLRIVRGSLTYWIDPLAEFQPDMYDALRKIIEAKSAKFDISAESVEDLKAYLRAAVTGYDGVINKLIPININANTGYFFFRCGGETVTTDAVIPVYPKGEKNAKITVAGETIAYTLSNIKSSIEVQIMTDGHTRAMAICVRNVVTVRAGMREDHPQTGPVAHPPAQHQAPQEEPDFGEDETDEPPQSIPRGGVDDEPEL